MVDEHSLRMEYARQEARAVASLIALGVEIREEPVETEQVGCTGCTFHAFDAKDEELDGGSASSLLGWIRDGYMSPAYLRPVA